MKELIAVNKNNSLCVSEVSARELHLGLELMGKTLARWNITSAKDNDLFEAWRDLIELHTARTKVNDFIISIMDFVKSNDEINIGSNKVMKWLKVSLVGQINLSKKHLKYRAEKLNKLENSIGE